MNKTNPKPERTKIMDGSSLRKGGPIGMAPHSGTGNMSQSKPNTANTTAHEAPCNKSSAGSFGKEEATYKGGGELGARGKGGA